MDRYLTDGAQAHGATDAAPRPPPIFVRVVRVGSTAMVEVAGEVDMSTAPHLGDVLASAEVADADLIVVDLQHTTYLDSSGIHVLLTARADDDRDRLRITNPSSGIRRIFDIAGITELLT